MLRQVLALFLISLPFAEPFALPPIMLKNRALSAIPKYLRPRTHRGGSVVLRPVFSKWIATAAEYKDLNEVRTAIIKAGLEASELIVAVDFTKSNMWNGADSFSGLSLHDVSHPSLENPYQKALRIVGSTLAAFDDDSKIPAFGFGDVETAPKGCFPFFSNRPCNGLDEVLSRYTVIASNIKMSGPTNFAPVIRKATEIVKKTSKFHVLIIVADGQVDQKADTVDAIVEASSYPLSIVCIGVGDGPWETMMKFDDDIPERRFDNFNFVCLPELERRFKGLSAAQFEAEVARAALIELPDLYSSVRRLGLL